MVDTEQDDKNSKREEDGNRMMELGGPWDSGDGKKGGREGVDERHEQERQVSRMERRGAVRFLTHFWEVGLGNLTI